MMCAARLGEMQAEGMWAHGEGTAPPCRPGELTVRSQWGGEDGGPPLRTDQEAAGPVRGLGGQPAGVAEAASGSEGEAVGADPFGSKVP